MNKTIIRDDLSADAKAIYDAIKRKGIGSTVIRTPIDVFIAIATGLMILNLHTDLGKLLKSRFASV